MDYGQQMQQSPSFNALQQQQIDILRYQGRIGSSGPYNPATDSYESVPAISVQSNDALKLNADIIKSKEENMITEVVQDLKKFVKDHKSVIYWVAVLYAMDHLFFNGVFKEKLKDIMQRLVGKVESKLNEATKEG